MNTEHDLTGVPQGEIVIWDDKYVVGIELIDSQHRQLVDLINQLYAACLGGGAAAETAFKKAMHSMVEYARFHFTAELKLLNAINFPGYKSHKEMHDKLVQEILEAAKSHNEGKKFVANHFVRTLKDWVMGHIAIYDKQYAAFVAEQMKKGVLTQTRLKEIEASIQ